MSGQQQQPDVAGTEKLIPTKQALRSLKSDVTQETAIKELIDNGLDSWTRNSGRADPATIEVYATEHEDEGRTELIVRDDTGGVRRDNASVVFQLGATQKSDEQGLIGTYGLGAKKALMNLGLPFTITSHHVDEEVGWSYTITEDWLEDDENWEVEIEPAEDIEPGTTEFRVHDLDYDWFEDDEEEAEDDGGSRTAPERLREAFGQTYNLFLDDNLGDEPYDLTIEVQGEEVQPMGSPDWAYTPFDDMYPRRFENITIDLDGHATTEVNITVGLLRKSDSRNAGIDVYVQGRQIVNAARDERVGFGLDLGEFDPGHDGRFKVIVEMETDGNGQDLPWDTQKNDLDPYNPIMTKVRNWIKRTSRDYFKLKDGRVPRAFVEYYPPSEPHAANGGAIARHNFESRSRVMPRYRPHTELPELKEVKKKAEAHALLRFRCERAVTDEQVPAYKARLASQLDTATYSELAELDVDPVDLDEETAGEIAGELEELAGTHVKAGVKYSDALPAWQIPKYEVAIVEAATEAGVDPSSLDEEEPSEGTPTTTDDLDSSGGKKKTGGGVFGPSGGEDGEDGEDATEEDEADEDETVELTLRVHHDGGGVETPVRRMSYTEAIERLGLDEDATRDELFAELDRRVGIALDV